MSEWIEWKGGECPVAFGARFDARMRNGRVLKNLTPGRYNDHHEIEDRKFWLHKTGEADIIAYRLAEQPPKPTPERIAELQAMADRAQAAIQRGQSANARQVAGTHYKKMGVEPWDVVDTWPLEQRIGAYRHGALKYLMRMGSKDESAQEIAKGIHYMEKLLEVLKASQ